MIFKKIERIVELQQPACRDFGLLIELSSKLFNWVSKIREIRTWRTWIWFNCLQAFQVRHTTKIKNPLYFYQMINPTWKLCNISEITYNLHITLIFCEINYKFLFYLQFWPFREFWLSLTMIGFMMVLSWASFVDHTSFLTFDQFYLTFDWLQLLKNSWKGMIFVISEVWKISLKMLHGVILVWDPWNKIRFVEYER